MSTRSRIEWTELTWNPTVGCTKVSPGCKHCYAETMAGRLKAMGSPAYKQGFRLNTVRERLSEPTRRRKPTVYFVNSMSDLFHQGVSDAFLDDVFGVIADCAHHTFQVLTKRSGRMERYFRSRKVPPNAWLGVSVEDQRYGIPRIGHLREVSARCRFLSVEPLLEELGELDLAGIHWVIVGGESGPRARPMKPEWVDSVRSECERQSVPFFFKQWGAFGPDGVRRSKKANGREIRGKAADGLPVWAFDPARAGP
ncbi:MAG: phage Gp37/Gp68 family protein [bacterium]|nr:phage Gp37/Gp68 family protein [bacterium]